VASGGQWSGSDRRVRLPKAWHAQRARVLRDHGRICHLCGGPGATEVDHVTAGDDHGEANLRPAHKACHARKSSSEGGTAAGQARKARAAARYRPAEPHPGLLASDGQPPASDRPRRGTGSR
jgi:5-methylcytosine-specific restriction enzyme A